MSISANPDFAKIQKKIDSEPTGFITQVIQEPAQVHRIVDKLKPQGFRIIPCVMIPSIKNANSAKMVGIEFLQYQDNVLDFIKEIHKSAGDILITSPNDSKAALKIFSEFKGLKRK
ncbi:MAG: hypothetical protein ACKO7N_10870 [Candidatus Nitrosotenuis sp.]